MPVRKTLGAEIDHLQDDKKMPHKQAVAVALKYQREGKIPKTK